LIGEIYLPAGELRFRLQNGVFSRCGPPSSRLRRDAASSFVIGFRWRVEQFALPIPLPDATVFSCDSFSPRPSGPACDARSRALHRWLETPCALRLGEPNHDGVTSGILCRTAALTQELHLLPSPGRERASPYDKAHLRPPPRQNTPHNRLFKATTLRIQDAFNRIDAQRRRWTEPCASSITNSRSGSAPFRGSRASLPCPGRAAVSLYLTLPWLASRLTSASPGRCFSPTSATDLHHEHSSFARLPSPQLSPR